MVDISTRQMERAQRISKSLAPGELEEAGHGEESYVQDSDKTLLGLLDYDEMFK